MNIQKRSMYFNTAILLNIFILLAIPNILHSQQAPAIEWQSCFGGTADDWASSIIQTSDGGFIIAGGTTSQDGDFSTNHGDDGARGNSGLDAWVIKLDVYGYLEWEKCFGGMGDDEFYSIIPTYDGGYIAAGYTTSWGGDVSGQHGGVNPYTEYAASDAWVVKLSSSGNIEWQKCLGGTGFDFATCIIQSVDEGRGYTIVGWTTSSNGDIKGKHGVGPYDEDAWIVKLSSLGNIEWQKCLGGSKGDYASSVIQSSDGGYIISATTQSSDGDVVGFHKKAYKNNSEGWIVKLSSSGNIVWQECLGGSGGEQFSSIIKTADGGYAVAGSSTSHDGDVIGNHGDSTNNYGDAWIIKLSSSGIIQWQKCLGGSGSDQVNSIIQTPDGGYTVAGSTYSTDGDVSGNHGNGDAWLIKLSDSGSLQWQKCLGGSSFDGAVSGIKTSDGGYVFAGGSKSHDGDVAGQHDSSGKTDDAWIVKLNGTADVGTNPASEHEELCFSTYPNPASAQIMIHATKDTKLSNVEIFDMLGRKWQCLFEAVVKNNTKIYTDALPSGSYFVHTVIHAKSYMIPFMVQH